MFQIILKKATRYYRAAGTQNQRQPDGGFCWCFQSRMRYQATATGFPRVTISGFHLNWTCILILGCIKATHAAETVLPQGDARPALQSSHFPDRLHEFVWRNWSAIEPAKLAKILGASTTEVMAIAESMGVPSDAPVAAEWKQRGYVTLIRRNWHLLPYDQLLELLEMTPERLAFALREDDFLWHKLGDLKPKCEPLRYDPPSQAARHRAAEIRRIVEKDIGEAICLPAESRFNFVRQLGTSLPSFASSKSEQGQPVTLRLVYSYLAVYGDPLLDPDLDPYPDGLLQRLSTVGVNGVWLHTLLRDIAPGGTAFPEFGGDHKRRLANLRVLVERAKKYGIGVYLYMNEPRAMPAKFFKNRPEMAGARQDELTALCTSHPAVRQWMGDTLAYVFREVPDLAGIYAITAYNTCEIASLPYIPVMNLVAEHCRNLASAKLDGMLIGWTMGGHPSPNFQLSKRFNREPAPDVDTALDALAQERFGPEITKRDAEFARLA